jgi:hypothetical protein
MSLKCEDCLQPWDFCTCMVVDCPLCGAEVRLGGALEDPELRELCNACRTAD